METKPTNLIVQGDVFLVPCNIPKDAKKLEHRTLAYGEVSGHHHTATAPAELYEKDGTMYLKTIKKVKVKHQEHKPIEITEGEWKIGIVKEVDPFTEEIRKVRD